MAYIERFVHEDQSGKRLNAYCVHYSPYTLAGYMTLKRILERYRVEAGNPVNYNAYTLDYYNAFKLWLTGPGSRVGCIESAGLKTIFFRLSVSHWRISEQKHSQQPIIILAAK